MKMPAAMRRVPEEDEFIFEVKPKLDVGHGRHPYKVDLRVLRDGFPDKRLDAGVSGRPDLAREVLPAFKSLFQSRGVRKSSAAFETQKFLLFWRFLDIYFSQVQVSAPASIHEQKIGTASCRASVCNTVYISFFAVTIK